MNKDCKHEEQKEVTFSTFVKGELPKEKIYKCKKCGKIFHKNK